MAQKERILIFRTNLAEEKAFYNELLSNLRKENIGQIVELSVRQYSNKLYTNEQALSGLNWYISQCNQPIDSFDRYAARIPNLKAFPFHICIFPITIDSLTIPAYRNAFLLCADSADLRPDVLCLPIRINIDFSKVENYVRRDEHLRHSLRRSGLFCSSNRLSTVIEVVDNFASELKTRKRKWLQQRLLRGFAAVVIGATFWLSKISTIGSIGAFVLIAYTAFSPDGSILLIKMLVASAAFLTGIRAAVLPPSPAFPAFIRDKQLKHKKLRRYLYHVTLPLAVWILGHLQQYNTVYQTMGFALGFFLSLTEQRIRTIVFELRCRLTGVENHDEHMKVMLSQNLPTPKSDTSLWDLYAHRAVTDCGRTIFPIRPRIFISYTWKSDDDKNLAESFAKWLHEERIEYFWDRKNLSKGAAWRSEIGIEISRSSHFIFMASENSVTAETCYLEVRQALGMMYINAMPSICVCLLNSDENITTVAKHEAFRYLIRYAYRIDKDQLFHPTEFRKWIKRTRPKSWSEDLFNLFVPVH